MSRVLAVIPARGGSTRIPGKNIRPMAGKPILEHTIRSVDGARLFDEIHVSTDSPEIMAVASALGFEPRFRRPDDLADNSVAIRKVVQHCVVEYEAIGLNYDYVGVISATACLITADTVQQSFERFLEQPSLPLLAVIANQAPPEKAFILADGVLEPWKSENFFKHTQDHDTTYSDSGTIAWFCTSEILRSGFQAGSQYRPFFLPRWMGIDIDTEDDWALAEYVMLGREYEREHLQ